ncbi:MAG: hypothetical protein M3373_01330 [Gemmatimonadota bacterium]|nr:hypothetical protein [Gemmatimonadota bacterium]
MSSAGRRVLSVLVALAGGCADFEAVEDPTFGLPDIVVANPSFSRDVGPILDLRCATGGCHTVRRRQGEMALESSVAYDEIVGVRAVTNPAFLRVRPGDADSSWLVRRIQPDPALRPGFTRMPLATTPLTPNQIATIMNWVEQGAVRD